MTKGALIGVSIAKELFYTTRRTDRSIFTVLRMAILQWSSSIQQGALLGVYLLCCVVVLQKSSSI